MKTPSSSKCPFHAAAESPAAILRPAGSWPPGPAGGLTGWRLLPEMRRDLPKALAAWQREFGDLVHLHTWPEHQIVVSDPRLARELLVGQADALERWERARRIFGRIHGDSVLVAEGDAWRAKRQALQPDFTRKASQHFAPAIGELARQKLAQWPERCERWPIEGELTSLAMDVIMRMLFSSGIGEDARQAERASHELMAASNGEFYWPFSLPDWVPWQRGRRKARLALEGLIERHLQARLRLPMEAWPEDLLSRLLRLHLRQPQAWTLQAVRDECKTTFLAGHETVAATLTWWAWCLAANPGAQAAARAEARLAAPAGASEPQALPYLTQTLQETLRLYPAAPVLISRRAIKPVVLDGWSFPVGTLFMTPIQLMQHDARWFPDPLSFRPERFDADAGRPLLGAYLPFGAGPRVCLGQHLALAEMTQIAAQVLRRFELSVPDGMAAPEPAFHISQRPSLPLSLRIARVGSADARQV
ncbi:cytochrome P450 [Chromobacterium alticapitis]|uniref:Cytochrome P450 n=1 Tax=Chromobacterium alticapitis TaxID=2073169 RepID=A0A2S5DFS1_9NEIS|nr:cytochrome P450 [Chromobacterium alticapitis]POZ61861.1 cytochrome P450 [Chromobacterium alticapitis]